MGKKLYGQGNTHSLRKASERRQQPPQESNGWLTLLPARPSSSEEAARDQKAAAAFTEAFKASEAAESADAQSLACSLPEYAAEAAVPCDCADAWAAVITQQMEDAGVPLASDGGDVDDDSGEPAASDVVAALCRCGVLVAQPPPLPPPAVGDPCVAILAEDGEWHAAVVAEIGEGGPGQQLVVRFLQWGKLQ